MPELAYVTVTGRYTVPVGEDAEDGTPAPRVGRLGVIRFTPAPDVLVSTGEDEITAGPVTARLDADGRLRVDLLATDSPLIDPTGWTYTVEERFYDGGGRLWHLALPAALGSVDLADVTPTDPDAGDVVYVPGPPGPAGPAGPPGPPGPAGGGAGNAWTFTQTTPAATWQLPHGLGYRPGVSLALADGTAVHADIAHASDDLAVVTFPSPFAGTATCT